MSTERFSGEIKRQSDLAYLIRLHLSSKSYREVWVPKSQCKILNADRTVFEIPTWFAEREIYREREIVERLDQYTRGR